MDEASGGTGGAAGLPARGPGGQPGPRRHARARPRAARRRGRPVRLALERCLPGRDADTVAAGRPGFGGVAGGLRGAAADLPGRRLAHAERGRPRPVRAHRRRLRDVPGRGRGRGWRRGPRPGRAGVLQPAVPRQPGLGAAGRRRGLRHRRRPGSRAGPGRPRRARRLLPALGGRSHRGGAVPLPADRGGPGKSRLYRTGIGACRRGLRTRPHRGGTARRHDLAGHRARRHDQATASAGGPGQRARLPGRPARRQLDAAAGAGRAHRPDPDRARLARRPRRLAPSARRSPAPTGARWPRRSGP